MSGLVALTFMTASCQPTNKPAIQHQSWSETKDDQEIDLYTLTSSTNMEVEIMTLGGAITSIKTPNSNGAYQNVVLGYNSPEPYMNERSFFGALIGRYGNRIADGQFTLNDSTYQLSINNAPNHLHGGTNGFDQVVWNAVPINSPDGPALELDYSSKDGEEGYPGNLTVSVVYTLIGDSLKIEYTATTDKATPINLTNHSFYNLAGEGTILDHNLIIHAGHYTPVDEALIPTGEIKSVDGTPFDFQTLKAIGARINQVPGGYDHNYALKENDGGELNFVARLEDPRSGRTMEIYTDQPGLQFYSGNFLDGSSKSGDWIFEKYSGLCLETQHFPDSPNHPNFPSTILEPGDTYKTQTVMVFGVLN